jgi:hypothetical protein
MKSKEAWGWLAAGVLALGLNGIYHDGGAAWAHRAFHSVVGRVAERTEPVLALALGHAEWFSEKAQATVAEEQVASSRWDMTVADFQSKAAAAQHEYARFQEFSAGAEAQQARQQARIARLEAHRARLEARMASLRIPRVHVDVSGSIACPRVHVDVPDAPDASLTSYSW